eukprot:6191533-Pleurochrysis_carterae.AAC.6
MASWGGDLKGLKAVSKLRSLLFGTDLKTPRYYQLASSDELLSAGNICSTYLNVYISTHYIHMCCERKSSNFQVWNLTSNALLTPSGAPQDGVAVLFSQR